MTSLILSIYLLGSFGVVINMHFCFGELKSVSIYEWGSENCCEALVEKAPCCDNQQIHFSVEGDQQIGPNLTLRAPQMEIVGIDYVEAAIFMQPTALRHPHAQAPPATSSKPWIIYQRLIWYG